MISVKFSFEFLMEHVVSCLQCKIGVAFYYFILVAIVNDEWNILMIGFPDGCDHHVVMAL